MIWKSFFFEHQTHVQPCTEFLVTSRILNTRILTSPSLCACEKASGVAFQSFLGHWNVHYVAETKRLVCIDIATFLITSEV